MDHTEGFLAEEGNMCKAERQGGWDRVGVHMWFTMAVISGAHWVAGRYVK